MRVYAAELRCLAKYIHGTCSPISRVCFFALQLMLCPKTLSVDKNSTIMAPNDVHSGVQSTLLGPMQTDEKIDECDLRN